MQNPLNSTRRSRRPSSPDGTTTYGLNSELESFLNVNASEAYKRPWHRLERGLRLNRISNFVAAEKERLTLSTEDTEYLKAKIDKALDKKLLNSKNYVVYDQETEEIKEIKGLIYHKTADGRMLSSIVDKKVGVTFRKKATKVEQNVNSESVKNVNPTE
jgi:hypothetical protein